MLDKLKVAEVGEKSSVLNGANKVKAKLYSKHANETKHNKKY